MNKYYYIIEYGKEAGPYTLKDLKAKRLTKSALIWTEGLEDWVKAKDIPEVDEFAIAEPPLYRKEPKKITAQGNGSISLKEMPPAQTTIGSSPESYPELTYWGVFVIAIYALGILLMMKRVSEGESVLNYLIVEKNTRLTILVIHFFFRFATTSIVADTLDKLNRPSCLLTLLGFIFPEIALLITGQLKKKPLVIDIDTTKSSENQAKQLEHQAKELISSGKYHEALDLCQMITRLNPDNEFAREKSQVLRKKLEQLQAPRNKIEERAIKFALLTMAFVAIGWLISVLFRILS